MIKNQDYIRSFITFCWSWCAGIIELQLFLSCMYIPILTAWGLSWPLISLISTPLFTPLFALFLLLSLCIFVAACFSLHVSWAVRGLEWVVDLWILMLQVPFVDYQIGFCMPPLLFLWALPFAALIIIQLRISCILKIIYLCCSLIAFYAVTRVTALLRPEYQKVITDKGFFYLVSIKGRIIVVDTGGWKKTTPYDSWYNYTLLPALTKALGITHVDYWVMLKNKNNFIRFVVWVTATMPESKIITTDYNKKQIEHNTGLLVGLDELPVLCKDVFAIEKKDSDVYLSLPTSGRSILLE